MYQDCMSTLIINMYIQMYLQKLMYEKFSSLKNCYRGNSIFFIEIFI